MFKMIEIIRDMRVSRLIQFTDTQYFIDNKAQS